MKSEILYRESMGMKKTTAAEDDSNEIKSRRRKDNLDKILVANDSISPKTFMFKILEAAGFSAAQTENVNPVLQFINKEKKGSAWKLTANIVVHGDVISKIEVVSLKEGEDMDETPFLKEESSLINDPAERLKKITWEKREEDKIKHISQVLRSTLNINHSIVKEKDKKKLIRKICNILISTRGYKSAWIVLLDKNNNFLESTQAGIGNTFSKLKRQMEKGIFNKCSSLALKHSGLVLIEDRKPKCGDCPLVDKLTGCNTMTIRLEYKEKIYGLLSVKIPEEFSNYNDEKSLLEDIAKDISFALYQIEIEETKEKTEKALRKSEEKYRLLFKNMKNGFALHEIVVDEKGKPIDYVFSEVNSAFEQLLDLKRGDIIGRKVTDVLPGIANDRAGWIEKYGQVALTGKEIRFEQYSQLLDKWFSVLAFSSKKNRFTTIFEDITEQKRTEQTLRESEALLRKSQSISNSGSWKYNFDSKKLVWSDNTYKIFGLNPREVDLSYETFLNCIHPDDRISVKNAYKKSIQKMQGPYKIQHRIIRRDNGKERIIFEKYEHFKDDSGKIVCSKGFVQDITEHKRAEEKLLKIKHKLEEAVSREKLLAVEAQQANIAKSQFLANMSHEIRTPMNVIIGMTNLALKTELNQKQKRYLNNVKISADGLLMLINDILDISKIEADKLMMEEINFELQSVIENAVHYSRSNAMEKKLELLCRIPPDLPRYLMGDPMRLHQIIVNLVGNAVKFTEKGEVMLSVKFLEDDFSAGNKTAVRCDKKDVRLHFTVSDTGIGIPADKLEMIFDNFTQVNSPQSKKYGGTGLGLAICSQLTHKMGGDIWVESEHGKGSAFHFTGCFKRGKSFENDETAVSLKSLKGKRLLIVDDNETNCEILREMTEAWGFETAVASSGNEALEIIQSALQHEQQQFSAALIDVQMTEMDEYSLVVNINSDERLSQTRLIMITSATEVLKKYQQKALGISGFLFKPVRRDELKQKFLQIFGEGQKVKVGFEKEEAKTKSNPNMRILLAEDNIMNQELVVTLLEEEYSVDVTDNGKQVLEMLNNEKYDLVLMDVQMPIMDGYVTTEAIRNSKSSYWDIPIIAMTANAMKGDRKKCLKAGMNDYIPKPIDTEQLSQVLIKYSLSQSGQKQSVCRFETSKKNKIASNSKEAIERMGGNKNLYLKMCNIFIEDTPQLFAQLEKMIKLGVMEEVVRLAHSIKTSAANIGADTLFNIAFMIERSAINGNLEHINQLIKKCKKDMDAAILSAAYILEN